MLTTRQAVEAVFTPVEVDGATYWEFRFGSGYALTIEPQIFGGCLVALYRDDGLILEEKIPFDARGDDLPPDLVSALVRTMAASDET